MKSLNAKIEEISSKYKQLRKCEFPIIQKVTIAELKKLSAEAISLMVEMDQTPQKMRRKKQIQDILKKCAELQIEIDEKLKKNQIGHGGRKVYVYKEGEGDFQEMRRKQMSKSVMRTIMIQEVKSCQLKISPQELEDIAKRMQNNLQVMKEIQIMVKQQGDNLQAVDDHLKHVYQNVEGANLELDEAKRLQFKNRMLKIRLGISGFFGAIGMKLFGWTGMFAGLFVGFKAVKK